MDIGQRMAISNKFDLYPVPFPAIALFAICRKPQATSYARANKILGALSEKVRGLFYNLIIVFSRQNCKGFSIPVGKFNRTPTDDYLSMSRLWITFNYWLMIANHIRYEILDKMLKIPQDNTMPLH